MVSPVQYTKVSWVRCQNRCHNPNDPDYHRYGAKGIIVCERWRSSFANFLKDMGLRPEGLTLDRIDSKGNYEPGNCRWATATEQNRHSRNYITYNGETLTVGEMAAKYNIKQTTLSMRLKRMSVKEAIETPVAK